jgi:hypothetical protein
LEEKILGLYARGVSPRDIQDTLGSAIRHVQRCHPFPANANEWRALWGRKDRRGSGQRLDAWKLISPHSFSSTNGKGNIPSRCDLSNLDCVLTVGRAPTLSAQHVQNRTVTVQFDSLQIQNSELVADLVINSQVGHKLPTGFPSRRVWVHFTVQDASGALLFESGRPNSDGSIQGNANDVDPARYEPHYQVIDSPDQVQIYEGIFVDVNGEITTGLLKGYEYIKDNRILPAGFDKLSANPEFAVFGSALEDEDFVGGIDRLRYQVELGEAQGPFTVTANVFYQTIGYRWMENLRAFQLPETDQMATYYDAISNVPVMLVKVSQQVGE